MRSRICAIAAAFALLVSERPLVAQIILKPTDPPLTVATTVTFTIPLKLTQLSPDLEKVRVVCFITSEAFNMGPGFSLTENQIPRSEMPVLAGSLVATMSVVVPIYAEVLKDPSGKTADYQCELHGFSKSLQRWDQFSETSTVPAFVLKPTPATIKSSFPW